jgi:hypothetical protein
MYRRNVIIRIEISHNARTNRRHANAREWVVVVVVVVVVLLYNTNSRHSDTRVENMIQLLSLKVFFFAFAAPPTLLLSTAAQFRYRSSNGKIWRTYIHIHTWSNKILLQVGGVSMMMNTKFYYNTYIIEYTYFRKIISRQRGYVECLVCSIFKNDVGNIMLGGYHVIGNKKVRVDRFACQDWGRVCVCVSFLSITHANMVT